MALLIVFPTTHQTLSAEKSLEKAGVEHRTIMKPRRISSDCGLAIRIDAESLESSLAALSAERLLPVRIFTEIEGNWECIKRLGEAGE